jgi:hypothetical protein
MQGLSDFPTVSGERVNHCCVEWAFLGPFNFMDCASAFIDPCVDGFKISIS